MGSVMGAFSAASVLGVPAGLELSQLGGWRAPFIGVGALGVAVVVLAAVALPSVNMNGVTPTDFSLPRSVMRSAQVAGGDVIPALAKAALL